MVEVCGKNWEIIIAVITGQPGFLFLILKTTTAGVKIERRCLLSLCVVRWCAGCFFASPAACIDFLVFEARQSEFFLLRHALFVLQWMFL
jgi:hypothetical protein